EPLDLSSVGGILPRGGTILRTSRTNPSKHEHGLQRCLENIRKHQLDALIAIGGDDTISVALKLHQMGAKVVGVPKTIDNDDNFGAHLVKLQGYGDGIVASDSDERIQL